jgi:predicted ribosome quality control (RQC) complex YloA/Tae2 family protein
LGSSPVEKQWAAFEQLIAALDNPTGFYLIRWQGKIKVSILPLPEVISTHTSVVEILNVFFQKHQSEAALHRERSKLLTHLYGEYERAEKALHRYQHRLEVVTHDDHFQQWGDLLMANLQAVAPGAASVTLPDFYPPHQPVTIRLRKELSPQKNAEAYYRKAKNRQTEIHQLTQALHNRRNQIERIRQNLGMAGETTDLKQVRALAKTILPSSVAKENSVTRPYKEFSHQGFTVWVGKNASANDTIIQQYAFKEDLWLHAKDVAGSHVLIKHQAGKPFPKEVIEFAARLAAGYSKRKTDSLCPVIVTPRKYVRKRKGDPPGTVAVERETVVMVEPWREA